MFYSLKLINLKKWIIKYTLYIFITISNLLIIILIKIINNMLPNINFYSGSALLANPPKSLHQSNKFDSVE